MKKIIIAATLMFSALSLTSANAAVSLKSSGDQWSAAVADLMNSNENGNWNESRFISTFNSRFNGTEAEARALLDSLKSGNVPKSADDFNNSISTPNPGGNGGSGSGVTKDELDASQKAQDDKQAAVDKEQDTRIKELEDNKPVDGKDGAQGEKGDKGDTGAAGKDGENGKDGADADMTLVNKNTSDIAELQSTKADKSDLNKETAERKASDAVLGGAIIGESIARAAGDAALNNKINQNAANQSTKDKAQDAAINGKVDKTQYDKDKAAQASTDKAQNTAINNAQSSANNAQNTANVALGVGVANTIGLGIEAATRANEDAKLQNQITSNKAAQASTDAKQNDHINAVQDAAQTANDRATDLEHRADASENAIRETNKQLEVTDQRSIDNANRLDGVEATNGAQDAAIKDLADTKADKTDLNNETAERIAGDKALSDTIAQNQKDQAKTDAKQNAEINNKVDKSTYAVDKAKQAIHDTIQDAAIVGLAVTKADKADLNKEVSDRKKADDVLQSNIDANKADQAVTDARQDQNLSTETDNRVAGDAALQANIDKNKAEQVKTDKAQDKEIASKASKKDLAKEAKARQNADAVLQSNIDSEASTRAYADTKLQSNIDKETDSRQAADRKLQSNINREANTRAKADAVLSSRIDTNDATLVQHDQRITSNTQRVGAVEQRQQNFENSTNKRFSQMDKKIGDNRKVASAGIAGAGAMANIPGLTRNGNFSVGAGIGGYDSEQAVAVGFNARVSENVTTKVSVSTNTQSEVLWGAGVGVEW